MPFNPRMLIIARESRRMTQKALAEASQTTQASVSRAEAGVHQPTPESVDAWAKALRYPGVFFARQTEAPPLPMPFWRKQKKLGKIPQKELEGNLAIRCLNIQALARSVELPEHDVPEIDLDNAKMSASDAARYVRTRWQVPVGPIADLVGLLEHNGILVMMLPGTEGFQGVSVHDGRADLPPTVFISADDPADRNRWTAAHELGHLVLHHHLRKVTEWSEDDANEFAAEFLMPAHEIRHHFSWRSGLADFAQLKLHWRVSMASLIRRARDLKVISDGHFVNLQRQLSREGYRRREPNAFEPEHPATIREMVRVHVEDLSFTASELGTLLALDLEDVRRFFWDDLQAKDAPDGGAPKPRLRLVE